MASPNKQPPSSEEMPALVAVTQAESSPNSADIQVPSDEDIQWLDRSVPLLKSFLVQEPNAHDDIERIFDEHLKVAPNADTSVYLLSAMQIYAGDTVGDLLLTILMRGADDRKVFDFFVDKLEEADRSWSRLLLTLYGKRVRDAWLVGGELPDDWMTLNQEVTCSLYGKKWVIKTNIVKYSGATFLLESRPGSYLNLIGSLLDTLRELDPEALRDSLDVAKLAEVTSSFTELFGLVHEQSLRQQLVEAILKVSKIEKLKTRTHWLTGIPQSQLARHAGDPAADIKVIVDQLDEMVPLESGKRSGERALLVFVDNVLADASEAPDVADELKMIRGSFEDKYGREGSEQLSDT
jgi:hypothetical protein